MSLKPLPEIDELTRPFWDAVQRGSLEIQRCRDCAQWVFYPNAWCTACYGKALEWKPVTGFGSVYSYSVVHYPPYASFAADVPYVLATIELDEGPHMMTNVVHCAWADVRIGMRVRLCFETRQGFRIPQFEPAAGAGPV